LAKEDNSARPLELIVANLHWRYTGVTATSRAVAPRVARDFSAAWLGPDAPDGIARLGVGGLLALWRRRAPVIWHARRNNEMIAGVALRALGWPLKLIFTSAGQRRHSWITRWLIARMDAVIATSAISASFLERTAVIVHHGVDAQRYAPPPDRAAAFAEAGLPGRHLIGCFGRVRAQKGTDLFVEAMCELLPRHPDFSAVIVGAITPDQAGFANGLRAKIAAAGLSSRLVILGERPIDEVVSWFRRLSIYAFTSRNEGYGLTLIEAMASGAALVAARAGAAEVVIGDSDAGVLVPTGDAAALAAAIEPLMRDPAAAAAMGARGRARVIEHFSLDAEAAAIAEVYRAVS
jgi:mannosyltransferase